MSRQKKEDFAFFLVLLFFAGLMIVGYRWSEHELFKEAYKPAVQEHQQWQQQASNEKPTNQPQPRGLKESEIQKQRGKRYNTW